MDSKSRLKDRLARIFRRPAFLRSTAAGGSRSLSAGESSRSFPASDIAHEPIFVPRRCAGEADQLHFNLPRRSLSLDGHPPRNLCGSCRPFQAQPRQKGHSRSCERRGSYESEKLAKCERSDFNESGKWAACVRSDFYETGKSANCERKDFYESGKLVKCDRSDFYETGKLANCERSDFYETGKLVKCERSAFYQNGKLGKCDGRTCPPVSPPFDSLKTSHLYYHWNKVAESRKKKKKRMKQRQRSRSNRYEQSMSSSTEKEGFKFFFSSEETDAFFSSRSFSSDSSEFYRRPSPKSRKSSKKTELKDKTKKKKKKKMEKKKAQGFPVLKRDEFINGFQPLVSVSVSEEKETKRRSEGFPVLKKSSDPYNDFRRSMAEMIVERQIFGARELERLLQSYLCLNSPKTHSAIFRAFADIAQVLFSY